jgi:electron transfer flavoprotein alpha subunit
VNGREDSGEEARAVPERTAVWAWVEDDLEVLGIAAELAQELGGQVRAVTGTGEPERLAALGADRVYVVDGLDEYDAESWVTALTGCLGQERPAAVLLPAGGAGDDLAPRLAAALDGACVMDCAALRPHAGGLVVLRWAHDDRVQERWLTPPGLPLVAALRVGGRGTPPPRPRPLDVRRSPAPAAAGRTRLLRRLPADPGSVRLADAERIVAAGLGIGEREMLGPVQELADLLGAALGASRPLADRGWVPFERQIGTTGQSVRPRLYVAIGISGAVQHTAGLKDVGTTIAINTDPSCPMMARAQLAVVGDAREVVPALVERLRAYRPEGAPA